MPWLTTYQSSQLGYLSLQSQSEIYAKRKYPSTGDQHDGAFQLIKKEIAATPILAYYNPKKPTVLQTDGSCKGLGACLLQNQRPIYFASRALSETQRGYVAIELESLAVTWAMKKCHHFLYSNEFVLETDQKPLEVILSKSLNQATPRLQCVLIRTFPYHFKVRYIPGPTNHVVDCLSRLVSRKIPFHYQNFMLTKSPVSSKPEVIACTTCK